MPQRAALLGLFCVLTASAQTKIAVDVQLVQIGFTVRNADGVLQTDLTAEDLEVIEDGKVQKIARFARAEALPLRLGVLADFSGSQGEFIKEHRQDLEEFLNSVLEPEDRAMLVGFGDRLRLLSEFSNRSDALIHYLKLAKKNVSFPILGPDVRREGGTAFFDSIYHSVLDRFAGEPGRRALVALSDGGDTSSGYTLLDAIEVSQRHDVRVFGLWYSEPEKDGTPVRDQYGLRAMQRLAIGTGGKAFDASQGGVAEQFLEIAEDLRSSYELGYYSNNPHQPGTFRKVEIRAKNPDLVVRTKTGYYAQ